MNRRNQQKQSIDCIDKIKESWYFQTPKTLYSLCIDSLVNNINIILVKNKQTKSSSMSNTKHLKYYLAETVGTIPQCISQSLIKSYAKYYVEQLGRLERNEFFQINNKNNNQLVGAAPGAAPSQLVNYYDLLLALASRPDRVYLNKIEYNQCLHSSSTLEQRIRTRLQAELLSQTETVQQVNSNYFRLYSATSDQQSFNQHYNPNSNTNANNNNNNTNSNKLILKSVRAQQPAHLDDKELKLILKNKHCEHLDICPCFLTNKSVHFINKYSSQNLKFLRLKNCCDWSKKMNGNEIDHNENEFDDHDEDVEDDEDDDEDDDYEQDGDYSSDQNESDLDNDLKFYFNTILNNYEEEEQQINDETDDDEDDNNDRFDFDVYLEEYLNRHQMMIIDSDSDSEHKHKRRRSHHHRHHYSHHIHTRQNKRNKSAVQSQPNLASPPVPAADLDDLENFLINNNLTRYNSMSPSTSSSNSNPHSNSHHRHHHRTNHRHKQQKNKKHKKIKTICKLFKLNRKARLCRKSLRIKLNSILNKNKLQQMGRIREEQQQSKPTTSNDCDREANSLIKWLVQSTIKNTSVGNQQQETASSLANYSNYSLSLIEQIKQRAALLAETKMIDKVSISSSNYGDDFDSSNNNNKSSSTTTDLNTNNNVDNLINETLTLSTSSINDESENEISSSSLSNSSFSTSSSSSSSSSSDYDEYFLQNSKSYIKNHYQQSSSPINMIQSLAAKALKFKLKNSNSFAQLAAQLSETEKQKQKKSKINLASKYNRLLKQYKTFKSEAAANSTTTASNSKQNNLFSLFKYWMIKKRSKKNDKLATSSSSIPLIEPVTSDINNDSFETNKKRLEHLIHLMEKTKRRNKLEKNLNSFTKSLQIESFHLVNLKYLSLRNLGSNVIDIKLLNNLIKNNLPNLTYLDISNCCVNQMYKSIINTLDTEQQQPQLIGLLDGLLTLKSKLTHLIMADLNVDDIQANLKYLLQMKQIQFLDISNCREKPPINQFRNASVQLAKLVYHLNKLTHLDISGTNLGGSSFFKEQEEIDYIKKKLYEDLIDEFNDYQRVKFDEIKTIKSDIAGLMFLNNEQKCLKFLGCFSCDNGVPGRSQIPAERIAGEDCEKNLYTSLETYVDDRPLFVLDALNHLFEAYRDELVEEKLFGGHLIMSTMEKNLGNSRIQISGSASLFYVLKYWKEENVQLPPFYLKKIIQTVITGMEEHIDEPAMRRNCVLIMCRLNLPDDVLFLSDRLIKILLKIFDDYIEDRNKNPLNDRQEHFVLRTAMHLLNILACSVHGNDKSQVGALAIPVAMNLIKTKTKYKESDDILEVTWSFLWNITDETPENCKIFLDNCDGMSAFMDCIQFKKSEITRNMMGLLGNVAEVKDLRNRLCKNDYIATFRQLLFYSNDGIEIPYNSAGVLVHIMSDGVDAWLASDCHNHDRQLVIEDIETAIDKWDLKSERNINYRSFEPIFRLVEQYNSSICQRWACWALANLTTVYPDIYCSLFEKENGPNILNKIIKNSQVNEAVKHFSRIVLKNVENKKSEKI